MKYFLKSLVILACDSICSGAFSAGSLRGTDPAELAPVGAEAGKGVGREQPPGREFWVPANHLFLEEEGREG